MAEHEQFEKLVAPQASPRKYRLLFPVIVVASYYHVAAAYGLYLCFTSAKWQTMVFNLILHVLTTIGITAGAHRLWAHRSYKATLPLQVLLMLLFTMGSQNSVQYWCRDHRLHHKYSDTDADPHNATRGFFYSHIGWLLVARHPEVPRRGKRLDLSDLSENRVLQFQKKYYYILSVLLTFIIPTLLSMYFWQETFNNGFHVAALRLIGNYHAGFLVNSFAHMYGYKPYDKSLSPTQNLTVSLISQGEGFHNYHHVFPFDYKAAELGNNSCNLTTKFIDFFAWLGWAYDLKYATDEMVAARMERTGDGTDLCGKDSRNKNKMTANK